MIIFAIRTAVMNAACVVCRQVPSVGMEYLVSVLGDVWCGQQRAQENAHQRCQTHVCSSAHDGGNHLLW